MNRVCGLGGASQWGRAFCQLWWAPDFWFNAAVAASDAQARLNAAVAAFWNLERDVEHFAVCPFYLVVYGRWKDLVFADANAAPHLPQWLREDVFFRDRLLRLADVPHNMPPSPPRPHGRSGGADEEGLVDLGKVKQQPADMNRWVPGVHQVIVRVGTARTGFVAQKRKRQQRMASKK